MGGIDEAYVRPVGQHGAADEATASGEFNDLFSRLLPRLYRRAVMLVGTVDAEDAVHETYLKLVRQPHRLSRHPEPYAYAFSALVSVVRDRWRRHRRETPLAEVPDAPAPADPLARTEAGWEVVRLLRMVPVRQAAAVVLVDLDGYTIDQAADILGVHRGTVSRARDRALKRLRHHLVADHERDGGTA